MTARELGEAHIHLTLTPKRARELLAILKDEVDWGYGLSDDLEALPPAKEHRLPAGVVEPYIRR